MKTKVPKIVPLGELVLAVFDKAGQYSADPREVSRLAARTVSHMLLRAPKLTCLLSQRPAGLPGSLRPAKALHAKLRRAGARIIVEDKADSGCSPPVPG